MMVKLTEQLQKKCNNKSSGIFFTVVLSLILLVFFYGNLLTNPNKTYFSDSGDGIRSYYSALYHIKYDQSYLKFDGMNYPFGEHVLMADTQPPVSFSIKFISDHIIDISDFTIGILNLFMLFSIVVAAIFIYMILYEFSIKNWYSILVACGISFLSPQIFRFSGHYSLSFVFVIPVILYLLTIFYKNPSYKKSIIISLYILIMGSFHLYHYSFTAFLLIFFWLVQIITIRKYRKPVFFSTHIFIQIIVPFLILQSILFFTDSVNDRTSYPWGFLVYRSDWEGIFLRGAQLNWDWLKDQIHFSQIEWEGYSYIGIIATVMYLMIFTVFACVPFYNVNLSLMIVVFIIGLIIHIFMKRKFRFFSFTDLRVLNILLWASIIALLISFAWPFVFNPEMVSHIGPLKQFRGIGRFAWIFFYIINIAAFIYLYYLKFPNGLVKKLLLVVAVMLLYYDVYTNNSNHQDTLNNSIEYFSDRNNNEDLNQWIKEINLEDYQAIIPIPYFHVGSENFWYAPQCDADKFAFIVSLKTGLPITGVMMGRTSINQTIENLQIFLEPFNRPPIFEKYSNRKDFLVIFPPCELINEFEKRVLSQCSLVTSTKDFKIFKLPFKSFKNLSKSVIENVKDKITKQKLFQGKRFLISDSLATFDFINYNDQKNNFGLRGNGALELNARDFNTIYDGKPTIYGDDSLFMFSFWFGGINKDVYPRTVIETVISDSAGVQYRVEYTNINRQVTQIDSNWALVEVPFQLKNPEDQIKVTIWNHDLRNDILFLDDLMVRPAGLNVYLISKKFIMKNNRFYSSD